MFTAGAIVVAGTTAPRSPAHTPTAFNVNDRSSEACSKFWRHGVGQKNKFAQETKKNDNKDNKVKKNKKNERNERKKRKGYRPPTTRGDP